MRFSRLFSSLSLAILLASPLVSLDATISICRFWHAFCLCWQELQFTLCFGGSHYAQEVFDEMQSQRKTRDETQVQFSLQARNAFLSFALASNIVGSLSFVCSYTNTHMYGLQPCSDILSTHRRRYSAGTHTSAYCQLRMLLDTSMVYTLSRLQQGLH